LTAQPATGNTYSGAALATGIKDATAIDTPAMARRNLLCMQ